MHAIRSKISLLAGGSVLLSACGGGWGMASPPDVVQASDELPITARSSFSGALANESFRMGSYRVAEVKRNWTNTNTRSSPAFGFTDSRTRGGYTYELFAGDVQLLGECATEEREHAQDLGDGAAFSKLVAKLGCSCKRGEREITLVLEASTTEPYAGTIKGGDHAPRVTALSQRENGRMPNRDPLGYRVDSDQPLGAVGVVKPGRVWLSKQLGDDQRTELACLFAGLLLYEPPRER